MGTRDPGVGLAGGFGGKARPKLDAMEEEAPAECSAETSTDWEVVAAPRELGLAASVAVELGLKRTAFASRGPGFETPGIKLDGGTILLYIDMRPDS
jgi:hypothetical protein